MLDKFNDECGVFGIFDHPEAANITYLGLYSLQHRGQESAGIVTSNGNSLNSHKGMGLVADVFNVDTLERLPGSTAIGHVRYSTTGDSHIKNAQPFSVEYSLGELAIAHNGNMVNAERIRDELEAYGSIFQSSMDTEVIAHLIATGKESTVLNRLVSALRRVSGSYSLILLTKDQMIVARDPHGFRPLQLGRIRNSYVVASETCAFDLIEGEYIREIEPGEVLVIDKNGLKSYKPFEKAEYKPCIFELIYFARPDSNIFNSSVYEVRKMFGRELANEFPVEADVVIPVPDSGLPAAIGLCRGRRCPV